jgi:hypothetical protein
LFLDPDRAYRKSNSKNGLGLQKYSKPGKIFRPESSEELFLASPPVFWYFSLDNLQSLP